MAQASDFESPRAICETRTKGALHEGRYIIITFDTNQIEWSIKPTHGHVIQ